MRRVHPSDSRVEELVSENRQLRAQVETLTKRVEALTNRATELSMPSESDRLMSEMIKSGAMKTLQGHIIGLAQARDKHADECQSLRRQLRCASQTIQENTISMDQATEEIKRLQAVIADIKAHLTCPITQEVFRMPCVTSSGQVFEEQPILQWVRTHRTCPITRAALRENGLVRNKPLENICKVVLGYGIK
jgi:hypothetical protein